MSSLAILSNILPASTKETIEKIVIAEELIRQYKQIKLRTEHVFHAGMYARTIRFVPNTVAVGTLMKIPTIFIINGICDLLVGDEWVRLEGYNVIPGNAWRKQICIARSAVEITMIFTSNAETVEDAEAQFTDEVDNLLSRTQHDDIIVFTGV